MWTWKSLGKLENSLYILLQNILFKTPGAHAVGLKLEDDWVTDSENTFAMWKEMTRTHPNQSLDTLIFLIILNSIWQFAAFPYI